MTGTLGKEIFHIEKNKTLPYAIRFLPVLMYPNIRKIYSGRRGLIHRTPYVSVKFDTYNLRISPINLSCGVISLDRHDGRKATKPFNVPKQFSKCLEKRKFGTLAEG